MNRILEMLWLIFLLRPFPCVLDMQNSDDKDINIAIASASLQPFTDQEWRINQQYIINTVFTGHTHLSVHNSILNILKVPFPVGCETWTL